MEFYFLFQREQKRVLFTVQYIITSVLLIFASCLTFLLSSFVTIENLFLMGVSLIGIYIGIFIYSLKKENYYCDCMTSFGCILIHIYFIGYAIANKENKNWIIVIMAMSLFCVFAGTALLLAKRFSEKSRTNLAIIAIVISLAFNIIYLTTDNMIIQVILAIIILIHIALAAHLFGILEENVLWKDISTSVFILGNLLVMSARTVIWDYGIILSLCVIIVSSLFIIGGFMMKKKGMRLFGLIIILMSIIKMILIDISETSSLIRVIAFIFGGIICFGISYVYNRLEKNLGIS